MNPLFDLFLSLLSLGIFSHIHLDGVKYPLPATNLKSLHEFYLPLGELHFGWI